MRKAAVVLGSLFLCFSLFKVGAVFAEEGVVEQAQEPADTGWKQQFSDDRQQLKEQRQEIKGNLAAAKEEERQLRQRIAEAYQANDLQKVAQLKEELRVMHHENVQGLQQDKQALRTDRQELKNDVQEARKAGNLPFKKDWDNNPPGPRGGPGASPDRKPNSGAGGRPHHSGRK